MTVYRNAAFAAIASVCLSFGPGAFAQSREAVTATVQTADLDLVSAAGQRRLNDRIRAAAKRACVSNADGIAGMQDSARCRAEMSSDAALKVAALRDRFSAVRVASAR